MREKRGSKFVYIVAAIGAAAGLGNLWRFPMLAYEYGGSAFILVLLLSNIFVVFPLVMMETIIGQKFQKDAPQSFSKIKKGMSWIQWIPIIAMIFVFAYYAPVIAWGVRYGVAVFSGNFLSDPTSYFATNILHQTADISVTGGIQWTILLALAFVFLFVLWSMRKGLKSVSTVLKYTVPIPFVLLIILSIRGLTLPGGFEGLNALLVPDWSALADIKLWQAAIGQSFFSASLACGYFIFAGSHKDSRSEVSKSTAMILGGNFLVSILSGIAIFSNLGYMAKLTGENILSVVSGGPDLVFSVLPTAIANMPFGKIIFAFLLFVVVFALGVSSLFAFVEIISGALKGLFAKFKRKISVHKIVFALLLGVFLMAIPYTTGAGIYFLDITDHFVGGYLFVLVGILETLAVLFFVGADKIRNRINDGIGSWQFGKWFNYLLWIIPICLLFVFVLAMISEFSGVYGNYDWKYVIIFGLLPLVLVLGGAVFAEIGFSRPV